MNQLRPSQIAIVVGGVVVLISSFLDWMSFSFGAGSIGFSAYENALFGLTGIFLLVIAVICIAVPLLGAFASDVKLPESVAGLSRNQVLHALGIAVLVLSFSLLFRSDSAKIGTILALLGSIAIVAGSHMEESTTS
jgi:hypothetical protein